MTLQSKRSKWLVLGTVCFGLFMVNLDGNVVSLAMPTIIRQFNASLSQMEWISNAYMLTFAVFLITLGRLGDQLGRKKLFLAGLVGFTLGSALCGAAQNVGQLIAFRVLQGIGGSAMMPATLSLITATFEKEERGRAMGFWGAASGLAFIMGPIIGGWLTQAGLGHALNALLGVRDYWRFVFFVNVPFGVLTFIFAASTVPESRDAGAQKKLDVVGVVLASLAVFLLTYGFIEGPRYGWLAPSRPFAVMGLTVAPLGLSFVPLCFLLAAVLGTAFILYERRRRVDPLMDLGLFRNRNYSVGMFTGVILNFGLSGAMFLMPLFCQAVLGIDPIHVGTLMLPFAFALLVSSPLAGILSDRIGAKSILVAGLAILAASFFLVAHFRPDTRGAELILPFVVMGIGMGLSMTPLTNLTLYGVPADKAGGASGVLSTLRQTGAVMGVAILSVVLQATMGGSIEGHARDVRGLPPAAQEVLVRYVQHGGLYGVPDNGPNGLAAQLGRALPSTADAAALGKGIDLAMKQSFTDGVNDTFRIAAAIGAVTVLVSLLMAGVRRPRVVAAVRTDAAEDAASVAAVNRRIAVGD
ncbi:MAG TPA: DHA2 family efflux MFS transporter permease subunit [Spirochaetia bacterium]|nr:DHA2 family efflux MFS transporter permease subunit [Spirochaetia bacterium]